MNANYTLLRNYLREYPSLFQTFPVDSKVISELLALHPHIPNDYVDFLKEFGGIDICRGGYYVYSVYVEPGDVFDSSTAEKFPDITIVADNFAGYFIGYDSANHWRLISIDSETLDIAPVYLFTGDHETFAKSFSEWITHTTKRLVQAKIDDGDL